MNKNILAIAIAAAVAAPSAFAAATVYGLAHMSVNKADDGAADYTSIASNSSRVGIKGDEDLGAGLKAIYQFETAVGFDGESTTGGFMGQRNTFAGIGGGFGTVLMGMHDTPYKLVGRKFDYFGDQIGDTRTFTNASKLWDLRPANVLAYASPSFGGVSILAAYVVDESKDATDKKDAASISATYTAGKLDVALGYENHGKGFTGVAMDAYRLGAGYDFGAFSVKAMYESQDAKVGTGTKALDIYGIGAGMKVGAAGTVKAQYYVASEVNNAKNAANLIAVGYDHAMSKNTTVYAAYSMTSNDSGAAFGVGTTGGFGEGVATAAAGKDPSAFSVGLKHKF